MLSLRENLPLIVGVIIVGVVVWILWRDLSSMRKTLTTVVNEHNQTASVLEQHKKAINAISMPMMDGPYDEDDDEYLDEDEDPEIEEIQEDVKIKPAKKSL